MNIEYTIKQSEAIGNLVNNLILTRGLKKKAIAEHAGISVNTLNNLISGSNVNLKTVLEVFDTIGISLPDAIAELNTRGFEFQSYVEQNSGVTPLDAEVLHEEISEGASADQLGWRLGTHGNKVAQVAETA
jgi:DNA-binding CsgD family transcriptional regulator